MNMADTRDTTSGKTAPGTARESPFRRFEELTRRLLAVPKTEVDERRGRDQSGTAPPK